MVGEWMTFSVLLIIGLINVIWPDETAEFTWAVRHGIDDEGRKTMENTMRILGIFIVLCCGIWAYMQL
ncbi:MAG: hypothetical protein RBQ70_00945 [Acholeplasma sp.]|jgi:hypothetical protein|nr:hypothetical protein [Acholeplasma sp.]